MHGRSVCGDLTSAFDFTAGGTAGGPALPGTDDFRARIARSLAGVASAIPARQSPTAQAPGQRPARALPYMLDVNGIVTASGRLRIEMANRGRRGAVLAVHDNRDIEAPWHFTIGAGDAHASEDWYAAGEAGPYDLTLTGPDGLYQRYAGEPRAMADVMLRRRAPEAMVALSLANRGRWRGSFSSRSILPMPVRSGAAAMSWLRGPRWRMYGRLPRVTTGTICRSAWKPSRASCGASPDASRKVSRGVPIPVSARCG